MARKRKPQRRKSKNTSASDYLLIIVLLIVLAAIAGGVVFLLTNKEKDFNLSSGDLCPATGARATVALLLDTTDKISTTTKQDIQNRARQELKKLPRFYRLSLYEMNDQGLKPSPVVTLCNPGQLTEMNWLAERGYTANPRMIQEKYNNFFTKISKATDLVLDAEFEGQQSPLFSALQELSLLLPKPNILDSEKYPAGRNKIIYITDLMEHTDTYSIYKSNIDLKAFQNSRAKEKFGKKYEEDLEFWVIRRNSSVFSTKDLRQFWYEILVREFDYPKHQVLEMPILLGET